MTMKNFFDDGLFLNSHAAHEIYDEIKDLPVIDYHCHLDPEKIRGNAKFSDIGELWLAGDHYKWRAMRLCGVEEKYITGNACYRDKFMKYAEILPKLAGNPLYVWSHLELKSIFGITEPLSGENAERIYAAANEKLRLLSVRSLFEKFRVEFVATTDDPCDGLENCGRHCGALVTPTFRPDKLLFFNEEYLQKLAKTTGKPVASLTDLLAAAESRLEYFIEHGCRLADHGFRRFPKEYASAAEAEELYANRRSLSAKQKEALFGYTLVKLAEMYGRKGIVMQMHFAVERNVNPAMFSLCGADSGFDVIASAQNPEDVVAFFARIREDRRPETILYTLNDSNQSALTALTGAFRNVRTGAAWWFNDTAEGIRKNLSVLSEYAVLGTSFGMLTDSRSFSSYVRFDFFRRILADFLGGMAERGEYALKDAVETAKNISYYNIKEALKL